jgi:hypothetical protein
MSLLVHSAIADLLSRIIIVATGCYKRDNIIYLRNKSIEIRYGRENFGCNFNLAWRGCVRNGDMDFAESGVVNSKQDHIGSASAKIEDIIY